MLRQQGASLPNLPQYHEAIERRRQEIGAIRFDNYEYQDQRLDLATIEQELDKLLSELSAAPAGSKEEARKLLEVKREYLDDLIADFATYDNMLLTLNDVERQLVDQAEECSAFIDERVLWIRSAFPWSVRDLKFANDALAYMTDGRNWTTAANVIFNDIRKNFWYYVPELIVFICMLYIGRPIRRTIATLGDAAARRGYYQFGPTLRALGLTIVISVVGPAIVWLIGWRVGLLYETSDFVRSLAAALSDVAMAAFALNMLRHVCRPKGLAHCHLQWPQGALASMRSGARRAFFFGLPLAFVILTLEYQTTFASNPADATKYALWSSSLGRILFTILMLVASLMFNRMVRNKSGLLHQVMAYAASTWLYGTRYLWAPALIGAPLLLTGMALLGYYHTAIILAQRLFQTGCLIASLSLIYGVLARGVLMRRRRLTIEQIRERRRLAEQAATSEIEAVRTAEGAPTQDIAEEVNLASISQQSVKIMQMLVILLGASGGWLIWKDIVPAITWLDNYPLWPGGVISIADALTTSFILVVTVAAVRNIPGILELTLLRYLPVDAGARYATTTLVRYTIAAAGIASAANASGFTLDKMQWLVATMGIGLGFGLQEIFANFVSGLILLFERPIRVGDIITLDQTTGIVSRIRMRATTIIDWDRKEYIVPNKDLVTGRLLNWTLTDPTNRIVIPVGVAYGSDTEKAPPDPLERSQ